MASWNKIKKGLLMKKLLVSVMTAGVLSTGAYAAGCNAGACSDVTVDFLLILKNGTITVGTSGTETGLTCNASGGKYLAIAANDPGKNAMYSALLTAQTTKKKISLRLNDTATTCKIAYVMSK